MPEKFRTEKLRIGHLSTFYHTAFVLMGTDWLAASGVDASWRLFPSGPDIMNAMGAGEIDLAYIGLPPAMIGIDKGMPVKCIAGGHEEGTVLVAQGKYLSIDEIGDEKAVLEQFSGKIIGCPPKGSIHDIIIRDLLGRYGGLGVDVYNFAWADFALAALTDGEIEAAIGTPGPCRGRAQVCRRQDRDTAGQALAAQPELWHCGDDGPFEKRQARPCVPAGT